MNEPGVGSASTICLIVQSTSMPASCHSSIKTGRFIEVNTCKGSDWSKARSCGSRRVEFASRDALVVLPLARAPSTSTTGTAWMSDERGPSTMRGR